MLPQECSCKDKGGVWGFPPVLKGATKAYECSGASRVPGWSPPGCQQLKGREEACVAREQSLRGDSGLCFKL